MTFPVGWCTVLKYGAGLTLMFVEKETPLNEKVKFGNASVVLLQYNAGKGRCHWRFPSDEDDRRVNGKSCLRLID